MGCEFPPYLMDFLDPRYNRGMFSTLRGVTIHVGDVVSTLGNSQYIGGISWVYLGHTMIYMGDIIHKSNSFCIKSINVLNTP